MKNGQWAKPKSERGIFKRGHVWYIRYSQNHRLVAEAVGPSKSLALKAYQKRKLEVAEGRFFPKRRRDVLFDEILTDAIARARERFEKKYPLRKFRAGRYNIVAGWFKGRTAASLTPQEISGKIMANSKAPATFNRYRVAISHAYKLAVENKKVAENPARLVKLLAENNERVRWLDPEEERSLRHVMQAWWPKREPELDLALHTGLRWAEQYSLRWTDVDLERKLITLPQPKGGKRERVPISSQAARALATLRVLYPMSELVCPDGGCVHRRWWTAAREQARLEDFTWHDLRHTFASRCVMAGLDILTVNKLMRHKTLQVTMRYAHLSQGHLHSAVEILASATRSATEASAPDYPEVATVH